IAISDYYEHIIKDRHPKGLVRRIYNGVQPEDFEGETVEIVPDKIIAFFHGRLVAQKGIALIAEAARRDKNILFIIAGGCSVEPDHAPLAADIDELKSNALKDNVLMLGRISQPLIGAYLRKADVAIYPHYRAPFDLAVLEAMACGTPTICTATDALLEYSTHNVNAYHIPEPPTVENLLKAIYAVAGDGELKKRISEGGKKKGQEMGWQRAAQQTVEFYREIINGYKI
ncbi:MAG: glycosyltransferase family 4 protein, partial [Candidatus Omnitrophica bacterium]|nr:glycosyltransferase family 4 protein [Candidatus Omnitrophota bacterium]